MRDESLITGWGGGGLKDGKIVSPELFAPPLKTVNFSRSPSLSISKGGNFLRPPPSFSMLLVCNWYVRRLLTGGAVKI